MREGGRGRETREAGGRRPPRPLPPLSPPGATGAFGTPAAGADPATFARYSGALAAELGPRGAADAVLVDGRFRVACALAALRHVRPGGVLMVHDWDRGAYHAPVLEFYDVVEVAER